MKAYTPVKLLDAVLLTGLTCVPILQEHRIKLQWCTKRSRAN